MRFLSLIFTLLLTFNFSVASEIKINGTAYSGEEIKLYTYSELFTKNKIQRAKETINTTDLLLSVPIQETQLVRIETQKFWGEFYLEPNDAIEITLEKKEEYPGNLLNANNELLISIDKERGFQLNQKIKLFDETYNLFIEKNKVELIEKSARESVDYFCEEFENHSTYQNEFYELYVSSKLAILKLMANHPKSVIYDSYISNENWSPRNPGYMLLIDEYYRGFINEYIRIGKLPKVTKYLSKEIHTDSIIQFFSANSFLNTAPIELKHYVTLTTLYNSLQNGLLEKGKVVDYFKRYRESEKEEYLNRLCLNLGLKSVMFNKGTKAPNFELSDIAGNKVSLNQMKGKYVYLDFWATWCTPCLKSMKLIPQLKEEYGEDITFVSISIDKRKKKWERFLSETNYNWVFLHFDYDQNLMEDYNIKAIPQYFLIDPIGNFYSSPAPSPENGIEKIFYQIKKENHPLNQHQKLWDWKRKR